MKKISLVLLTLLLIIVATSYIVIEFSKQNKNTSYNQTTDIDIVEQFVESARISEPTMTRVFNEDLSLGWKHVLTNKINIVALGDSLTQGVGDETNNEGYAGIVQNTLQKHKLEVTMDNFGKRGRRVEQLLKSLEDENVQSSIAAADLILMTVGANDLMKIFRENIYNLQMEQFSRATEQYRKTLQQTLFTIRQYNPDANIYLVGFYNPYHDFFAEVEELTVIVDEWNDTSANVMMDYDNSYFVPISDLFQSTQLFYLADDYFHPNYLGYRLIAERVIQYIENTGEFY